MLTPMIKQHDMTNTNICIIKLTCVSADVEVGCDWERGRGVRRGRGGEGERGRRGERERGEGGERGRRGEGDVDRRGRDRMEIGMCKPLLSM